MAYLVKTTQNCHGCNSAPATVEVFNDRNASIGHYCRACGERRVRLLDHEQARRKDGPAR